MKERPRCILGLETSCDETAAAVVGGAGDLAGRVVLSNVIASQHDLHAEYGGVVPEIASRAHAERILPVVREALCVAGVSMRDVEAVAVGNRPGLIGSLLVGVSAAKALAWSLGVPLVGVDHVRAHLFAGLMAESGTEPAAPIEADFPALGLVVSGGHTSIFRCESPTSMKRLGGTIDDAMGEAFDKVGAILGLAFPGGPAVDRAAREGDDRAFEFPVSRLGRGSLDFSFSGLKTAVKYAVEGVPGSEAPAPPRGPKLVADVCASFQRAACRAIVLKLSAALDGGPDGFTGYRALLVGGGVSANSRLRAELVELARERGLEIRLPPMGLCVDNAAMIAGLGYRVLDGRGWAGDELTMTAAASAGV
ncbi:MAG: tRNA (adenosine(37)-N6)-threonylcarbamoyltransferase complex transferase subunit TsaD [Phycisphaerales bacterium]